MQPPLKPVERLFPFAVRSGIIVPGRDAMAPKRHKLLFVLITTDLTPKSRDQIQRDFRPLPIVERYTAADVQAMFTFRGAKVLGFLKCPLSRAILREMQEFLVVAAPVALAPSSARTGSRYERAGPEFGGPRVGRVSAPTSLGRTASGQNDPQLPPPPPSAEPVLPVKSPPEVRLGWRARRKQQKDERIAVKLRKQTPLKTKKP